MKKIIPSQFKFYPFSKNTAAYNMAFDQLLCRMVNKNKKSFFRIYSWIKPSISIGFFQKISGINLKKCKEYNISVVRRMTGGRAIFHCHELTYSIAFHINSDNVKLKKSIFKSLSKIILSGLQFMGYKAEINENTKGDLKTANCFKSTSLCEISDSHGNKLVGSAMLIKNNTLLLQGSIPLSLSYLDIEYFLFNSEKENIPYKNEYFTTGISDEKDIANFLLGIKSQIKLESVNSLSSEEVKDLDIISQNRYLNDSWTLER